MAEQASEGMTAQRLLEELVAIRAGGGSVTKVAQAFAALVEENKRLKGEGSRLAEMLDEERERADGALISRAAALQERDTEREARERAERERDEAGKRASSAVLILRRLRPALNDGEAEHINEAIRALGLAGKKIAAQETA